MSRIIIRTQFASQPLQVIFGWDRPLQHCFLDFTLSDAQEEDPKFAAVRELREATCLQPLSPEDIEESLETANIAVPPGALADLREHQMCNCGNTVIGYDANGVRKVLTAVLDLPDLLRLWDAFGNTPIDENDRLDEPFLHFERGVAREDVWRWFEAKGEGNFLIGHALEGRYRDMPRSTR